MVIGPLPTNSDQLLSSRSVYDNPQEMLFCGGKGSHCDVAGS